MAFFGSKKSDSEKTSEVETTNISSATIITKGSRFEGNLLGNDTVHVDGEIIGNVAVNNIVIVGKSGVIKGDIKAQKIICSGKIEGKIECKVFELIHLAVTRSELKAENVILDGNFTGEVLASKILVNTQGEVANKLQAKEIVVKGKFEGDLCSELLTTKVTGKIKGNMFVKNILNEGGMVEGSIGQFKELFVEKKEVKEEVVKEVSKASKEDEKKS